MTDFANVLFGGPCNRRCYYCIGESLPKNARRDNLREFPPLGMDAFVREVNARRIAEVVFTGTVTDPQLYAHESELLAWLKARVHGGARYSLHTNGVRALKKLEAFNAYDRVCISFPSFDPDTYAAHMGSRAVPDLAAIVRAATIPLKVSCVLDARNAPEVPDFLARLADLGITRVVFRKIFGTQEDHVDFDALLPRIGAYNGNPLYGFRGMTVGYWDFDAATSTSVNLFPDGTLGTSYRLTETTELVPLRRSC
jgi:MoaA/NifB/PqqE/SkfB family radical SAM enzyme